MASKIIKPFIQHIVKRGQHQCPRAEATVERCAANKCFVAVVDDNSPVTRVTVAFRAGSRYESPTDLGLSHVLRSSAGLTTSHASIYIMSRKLSQVGATVTASGDREIVYYTLETTQEHILEALEQLGNMISTQEFRPWELSDNAPRLKHDLAAITPQVRVMDLLHKAAFRRGLGNSLFISPRRIGKVSSESLQHFAASNLVPDRCAVSVVGGNMDQANFLLNQICLPDSTDKQYEPSPYFGGELRKETGGELAHVALGLGGANATSAQALQLAVAARALGTGPATKWGNEHSLLGRTLGNIGPFAAAGFNASYSDNGLFGVILTVPKNEANAAVKATASLLKRACFDESVIAAAKNKLKLEILSEADNGANYAESLAAMGLYRGEACSALELANMVDTVSCSAVSQVVAAAANGPISLASVGNIAYVPYRDEL